MEISELRQRMRDNPDLLAHARACHVKYAQAGRAASAATAAGKRMTFGDFAKLTAMMTGAGVVGSVATAELMGGYQAAKSRVFKGRNFRKMMKANPDLEQLDKKQVRMAFNTVNRFNPEFASDPLVAGTWTRQIAGYGEGVPVDRAAQLVNASSALAKTRGGAYLAKSNPTSDALAVTLRANQEADTAQGVQRTRINQRIEEIRRGPNT
jgi:hypothetical protein